MATQENKLPKHVAIIMDGNGRWGVNHYGKRTHGHIKGVQRVREIVRRSSELNLKSLRLWGYSTDNWKRAETKAAVFQNEVNFLMWLYRRYIIREADELDAQQVKVTFVGRRQELPERLRCVMQQLEEQTYGNVGLKLEVALNYGGYQTVVDAVSAIADRGETVSDETLASELYGTIPPPDLIIRTSGERRTSGFQPLAVHAEWEFVETPWPDFTADQFEGVLRNFHVRERRFGGVKTA